MNFCSAAASAGQGNSYDRQRAEEAERRAREAEFRAQRAEQAARKATQNTRPDEPASVDAGTPTRLVEPFQRRGKRTTANGGF